MPYWFAKLWRWLLWAYPAEFREEYGPSLTQDFADRYREESGVSRWQLCVSTVVDVIVTGAKERYFAMMIDLKHSARRLLAQPLFATVAVLSLALGIGANSAVFSIVNDVLLNAAPYPDADRRVVVHTQNAAGVPRPTVTPADFLDYRVQSRTMHDWILFSTGSGSTAWPGGTPEKIRVQQVTPGTLESLGTTPVLGRFFREGEVDQRPCLISESYWRRRFGGSRNVINTKFRFGSGLYTIVGIVPAAFALTNDPSVVRRLPWLVATAKLRDGFTEEQAQQELVTINARLAAAYPESNAKRVVSLRPMVDTWRLGLESTGATFFGAVSLILLIACANVANLLLVRAAIRRREISVRSALGADRRRLVREFLADGLVLSVPAVAVGLALAFGGLALFRAMAPPGFPGAATAQVNLVVLGFTAAAGVLAGILSALFPALQASKVDLSEALKEGGRSSHGRRTLRLRTLLVAGEIAFTLVLLAGAGLLLATLWRIGLHSPGFDPRNISVARVSLVGERYDFKFKREVDIWKVKPPVGQFDEHMLTQLRALPDVESVALSSRVPMGPSSASGSPAGIRILGATLGDGKLPTAHSTLVSSGFFETLRIPLRRGRLLNDQDHGNAPWVAVVNEAFARELFPDGEALGAMVTIQPQGIAMPEELPRQIVGIVSDHTRVKPGETTDPMIYTTYLQQPEVIPGGYQGQRFEPSFVIRTRPGAVVKEETIRRIVTAFDPDLPLSGYVSLEDFIFRANATIRFYTYSLVLFAAIAIGLAGVGIYGLMNYAVADRIHEIGIRISLGASRSRVVGMVVGQGLRIAVVGIVVGLAGALATTGLLRRFLFEIEPWDPPTYALAAALVLAISLVSCGIPAWRATRVNPVVALRRE